MSGKRGRKITRRRVLQAGASLAVGGALGSGDATGAEPPAAKPGVYESLGVRPVINATGTVTALKTACRCARHSSSVTWLS